MLIDFHVTIVGCTDFGLSDRHGAIRNMFAHAFWFSIPLPQQKEENQQQRQQFQVLKQIPFLSDEDSNLDIDLEGNGTSTSVLRACIVTGCVLYMLQTYSLSA